MTVELQTSATSKESPVDVASLQQLIDEQLTKLDEPKRFIEEVAAALHKKSTKHKFIVLVMEVRTEETINENLKLKLSVGTVWDGDRDGYHHFKVAAASTFMVTVFWIYVG